MVATHQGAELDLLLQRDGRLYGVECKRVDAPRLTPSLRIALEDLKLDRIAVVYPGPQRYAMTDRIVAVPLSDLTRGGIETLLAGPWNVDTGTGPRSGRQDESQSAVLSC